MILTSLDNIPDSVLDKLVELYGNDSEYIVHDNRKPTKPPLKNLFEFGKFTRKDSWVFLWENNNLKFFYYRKHNRDNQTLHDCQSKDYLQLLNELLNNSKTKEDVITQIKDIIKEFGEFGIGDIEIGSSPCINSNSYDTIVEVVERFCLDFVESTTYDDEVELHTTNILYENLNYDILLEILELANQWKQLNLEENE